MIRYLIAEDAELRVEQVESNPTIYLDHWAFRHISTTDEHRIRFVEGLKARGGTLMLSWLNLAEFTKVTDLDQAKAAEALVEAVLPNVFFMEINPFMVIEQENVLMVGGKPRPPHADTGFLRAFSALKPKSLSPFTAHDLFVAPHESALSGRLDDLADTIAERTEALRIEIDNDSAFRSLVSRLPSGPRLQQGTLYILRELARTFLIDRSLKVSRNNAIDLLHSVVPVAYCDLVLLDKHWQEQVDRMRTRLKNAKLNIPVARVFSRKNDGLNRFLAELEAK